MRLGSPHWKPQNVLHQCLCSRLPSTCSPSFQATWPVQATCRLLAGGQGNLFHRPGPAGLRHQRPHRGSQGLGQHCTHAHTDVQEAGLCCSPAGGPAEPLLCLALHLSISKMKGSHPWWGGVGGPRAVGILPLQRVQCLMFFCTLYIKECSSYLQACGASMGSSLARYCHF